MVALWGGLGAPTHSPGTTDRRCSLPFPFYSPKIQAERAPAIPAADDVSAWVPARFACFRRYLDDFDFQPVPPFSSAFFPFLLLLPRIPPPFAPLRFSTFSARRRESVVVDGRFRHAMREIEKRGRERERICSRKKKKKKKKRRRGAWRKRLFAKQAWIRRENRVDPDGRDPFVSSGRSIVYPGVDRWPIYTCTVAPPRAQEDRHKWSSTRHSEAFHAAGVLATRYASTPTPSTPSRISSGRKSLSSVRWRQGVVRRDVTWPVYINGRRAALPQRFPAFFDL